MKNNLPAKPLILQRADPFIYKHTDGYYYFTASVPEYDRIELRRAKTLDGLATCDTKDVWHKHTTGIMSEHIWAPEIHYIDDKWYIYFAASEVDDKWALRPYVLECSGDNPMTDEWIERGMIQKNEKDPFSFTGFSLDATTFSHNDKRYLIWAEKVKGGAGISNLYIAEMSNPYTISTVQMLLTTPDFEWERIGFWVCEGPAVIKRNGYIFVSYSASATDSNYCMGLLKCKEDADLLDPNSWTKSSVPVLTSDDNKEIFGPGHNSFTVSEEGEDLFIYHARPYEKLIAEPLYDPNRHTFVGKLDWNDEGEPIFIVD